MSKPRPIVQQINRRRIVNEFFPREAQKDKTLRKAEAWEVAIHNSEEARERIAAKAGKAEVVRQGPSTATLLRLAEAQSTKARVKDFDFEIN